MREAELAAWSAVTAPAAAQPATDAALFRLPSAAADSAEGRLHLLLAGTSALVLGYIAWTAWRHAPDWNNFVEYVRQLLG